MAGLIEKRPANRVLCHRSHTRAVLQTRGTRTFFARQYITRSGDGAPLQIQYPERLVVAYKGGIQERFLLHKLGLPYLDLEDLGCPRFDQLVDEPGRRRFDCSRHLHMRPDIVPHCPEEECYQFVTWTLEE